MTITEDLIAAGERLRALQEKAKAELEAERAEQRRREAEWQARRDAEWAAESKRPAATADVLPWPKKEEAK